jgi:hypothetical protein
VDKYIEEEHKLLQKEQPKEKRALGHGRSMPQWIPPPEGMTKINVDASISKNMKVALAVAIARGFGYGGGRNLRSRNYGDRLWWWKEFQIPKLWRSWLAGKD